MALSTKAVRCLGTRMVVLKDDRKRGFPGEGLLVVQSIDAADDAPSSTEGDIRIDICNGVSSFSTVIRRSKVRLGKNDLGKLATYLLQDGSEHPSINITIKYNEEASLSITIKQQTSLMMMKVAYEETLNVEPNQQDDATVRLFLKNLGMSFNAATKQLEEAEEEQVELKKSLNEWKDTAQKLGKDVWQAEKDQLLQNFLTLLNETRAKSLARIEVLEEQPGQAQERLQDKDKTRTPRVMYDGPDDLDEPNKDPIAMDEAAALAAGRKTKSNRKQILSSDDTRAPARVQKKVKETNESINQEVSVLLSEKKRPRKTKTTARSSDLTSTIAAKNKAPRKEIVHHSSQVEKSQEPARSPTEYQVVKKRLLEDSDGEGRKVAKRKDKAVKRRQIETSDSDGENAANLAKKKEKLVKKRRADNSDGEGKKAARGESKDHGSPEATLEDKKNFAAVLCLDDDSDTE